MLDMVHVVAIGIFQVIQKETFVVMQLLIVIMMVIVGYGELQNMR